MHFSFGRGAVELFVGVAACAALIVGLTQLLPGEDASRPRPDGGATRVAANPVSTSDGGVGNVALYYQGNTKLAPGEDLSALGKPSVVVTTGMGNEAEQIDAIHSIGAKAYRYVQYYWAPRGRAYEGVDFPSIHGWEFCRTGSTPLAGRDVNGEQWDYIDTNEKAVRDQIRAALAAIKARGWDGVMFDRGAAATQAVLDTKGRRNWFRTSTCTHDPQKDGATFSDAYISMVGMARGEGLETMMNNGRSPFDPTLAMRPDPKDKDCRAARWSSCRTKTDAFPRLDLVLNETAARPKAQDWERTFVGNKRSEQDKSYGRRTVAAITTAGLGGVHNQKRPQVFFAWSRVKLFDLPVAVNTGDDNCRSAEDGVVCNRFGLYPDLTNIRFGKPVTAGPTSRDCERRSTVKCTWTRQYADGMNVVNVSAATRTARLPLGVDGCRYVYDVFSQAPLNGNRCVSKVRLDLPAWSGRPLLYATTAW